MREEEITRLEAQVEAINARFERQQQSRKASIMGSAVEMDHIIAHTGDELRLKIMKCVADLTDSGLELSNPHCHKDLPDQTKGFVIDLAQLVEQAIEEFIDDGQ